MNEKKILSFKNLNVTFNTAAGKLRAVRDVSIDVKPSEILAIVGESGSGKSVMVKSLIRILPEFMTDIEVEALYFMERDLTNASSEDFSDIRGRYISMIFQNPMSSLNPVFTIGEQIQDVVSHHSPEMTKEESEKKVIDLLKMVKIPNPIRCAASYPHQFSGGMLQRAIIAMSFASPDLKLIIADEPTTALDVTVQAEILRLMRDLKEEQGVSFIFITHDMGVVCEIADRVAVLYASRLVEKGTIHEIIENPKHPYTKGLLKVSVLEKNEKGLLNTIGGILPNIITLGEGCPFAEKCDIVSELCLKSFPEEKKKGEQLFRCHHVEF